MTVKVLTSVAGPVALNRLLLFMEGGRDITGIRPWVWIVLLSFAPLLGSVAMQLYIFIATRLLVRTEGLITQLVFEHALKIRATDDTPSKTADGSRSGASTAVQTPAVSTASLPDESPADEVGTETADGSPSTTGNTAIEQPSAVPSPKGKGKENQSSKSVEAKKPDEEESSSANLSGKITNLVSTDLGNITNGMFRINYAIYRSTVPPGRDFLFVVLAAPLQAGLSIWFLYEILGWSSLVGLACMLLTLPLPGERNIP